ncbi:hypothetical protein Hanom_Chr13g01216811 [Helianthus anomalus]
MTAGAEIVCNEVVCKVETMEKCGFVARDSCGWRWECKKAALDGNESRELLQFVSVVGVLRVTSG